MQTVWSRVAQVRSACSCPQCHHAVQATSRRAAASAAKRGPRHLTSSTLWYSGIFAAAATFDAGRKERRREQWDQAIAGVKHDLGRTGELAEGGYGLAERASVPAEGSRSQNGLDALLEEAGEALRNVDMNTVPGGKSRWPENTGPPLLRHRLPPNSIYAPEEAVERAETRRLTPKKMETIMLSFDLLQLQLIRQTMDPHHRRWRTEALATLPDAYRDKMSVSDDDLLAAATCKALQLESICGFDHELTDYARLPADVPLSRYCEDEEGDFHQTARELNASLRSLFSKHSTSAISTPGLLAKIAYNLSISPAPPNIDSYNVLLLGLSAAGQVLAIKNVIRSLHDTHVRPNEITNTAILNFYIAQSDARSFVKFVGRMRGRGDGLALARPDIVINLAGAARLVKRGGVRRDGASDKIVQLPYPTPSVFGALIRGMLKFSNFENALGICEGMGNEGWGLCMEGLTPLLMDCAERKSWEQGVALWKQIQALRTRCMGRDVNSEACKMPEKVGLHTYAAMLRLCLGCGEKKAFQETWNQAVETHRGGASKLTDMVMAHGKAVVKDEVLDAAPELTSVTLPTVDTEVRSASGAAKLAIVTPAPTAAQEGRSKVWGDPIDGSETKQAPDGHEVSAVPSTSSCSDVNSPTILASSPDGRALQPRVHGLPTVTPLLQEQLYGGLPGSYELDEYELFERPMTI